MIVADTDVLIDYLRGHDAVADRIAFELQRGLATTAVTAFELWAGSLGSAAREQAADDLLAALRILPLEPSSARRAAGLKGQLQSGGLTLPMADALIAGICVEHNALLLTRNRRHFEAVPGLSLGTLTDAG